MEKYGVEEELPEEKTGKAESRRLCPDCGAVAKNEGVLVCPKCGTKPFEKK